MKKNKTIEKKIYQPTSKTLKEGAPFPLDFWNYNINPIVGYKIPEDLDHHNKWGEIRRKTKE